MKQYSFIQMSKAFPKNNIVAQWIVGLAVIHNDFVFLKKQLFMKSKDISELVSEAPSNIKLLAASLREAIFYLEESEKALEIKTYIKSLPYNLIELYNALTPLFRSGKKADLLQRLTNVRNITYHFSKPQRNELVDALKELQDQKMPYEDRDERFLFAEHVRNIIMIHSLFDSEEIESQNQQVLIMEVIGIIKEASDIFIEFSREVNKHYLKDFL